MKSIRDTIPVSLTMIMAVDLKQQPLRFVKRLVEKERYA